MAQSIVSIQKSFQLNKYLNKILCSRKYNLPGRWTLHPSLHSTEIMEMGDMYVVFKVDPSALRVVWQKVSMEII